ncbi:MAG: efflux RND transporter periplasmic adaptor subunit [Peptococcaceae bacterium]|jgi:RND family efflux transporter MFP subunit|nr:efflux RND transporter periplasmic adaptor subunit [Peptococcaceae bacterium]
MKLPPGYKNKKLYVARAVVLSIAVLICLPSCFHPPEPLVEEPLLVRSMVVRVDANGQRFTYSGEVHGRYESQLAFRVNGKILVRNVDVGSLVQPGEILMQLDPADSQLSVRVGEAALRSVESKMKLAKDNLVRAQALYETGGLSKAEYEAAMDADNAAEAAYQQAAAQLNQLANQLQYCDLTADYAGVVSAISVEAGQLVAAGTPVITLVQEGDREVEISVPENRVDGLSKATSIKVSFWALPNVILDGWVREVSPVADSVARTFKARVSLVDPPTNLKAGMTSSVELNTSAGEQASLAAIPLAAVYQTGDGPAVWIISDGIASLRKIQVAGFDRDQVNVSSGLNDGEVIVTAGVNKLLEGQKVRLMETLPQNTEN